MIERDLKGPSAATIAAKLLQYFDEFEPAFLLAVRRYSRPHLLSESPTCFTHTIEQTHHENMFFYKCTLGLLCLDDQS